MLFVFAPHTGMTQKQQCKTSNLDPSKFRNIDNTKKIVPGIESVYLPTDNASIKEKGEGLS